MKKIGIVTVLYKSDVVLYDFFESIGIQDYTNFTLYIIDNSANETTKNLVFKLAKEFTISEKKLSLSDLVAHNQLVETSPSSPVVHHMVVKIATPQGHEFRT